MEKKRDFEQAMQELEKIVDNMENGELPLEAAIEEFEKGMALIKECRDKLLKVRGKITKILETGEEIPFEEAK